MNEQFNLDCLKAHNELRSLHKVPPLELSIHLAEEAQIWADVLSKKSKQNRKKPNDIYGENASFSNYIETGEETTFKWYKEISEYKFGQERQNMAAICHFAQIVWNDTTEVGFGRSKSDSGEWVVVGRYRKPGNIVGKFLANVHQKIMGWENYPIIIKFNKGNIKNIPITILHSKPSVIGNAELIFKKEDIFHNSEEKMKYNDKYIKSSTKPNNIMENNDWAINPISQIPDSNRNAISIKQRIHDGNNSPSHTSFKQNSEFVKVNNRQMKSSINGNQKKSENYDYKSGFLMNTNNSYPEETNSIAETIDDLTDDLYDSIFDKEAEKDNSIRSSHLKSDTQKNNNRNYNERKPLNKTNVPKGLLTKEGQSEIKRDQNSINRKNGSRQDHLLDKLYEDDTEKENKNYSKIDSKCEIIQPKKIRSNFAAMDLDMDADDPDGPVLDGLEEFQNSILIAHNECRKLHSAKPLKLNSDLAHMAQKWANHIAKFKTVGYSNQVYKGCEVGENILIQFKGSLHSAIQNMVTKWYNEKELFQFDTEPMNIDKIGHFSQIVWKTTQEIGIGISDISNYSVIVCFYFPSGNTIGQFLRNVSSCEKNG